MKKNPEKDINIADAAIEELKASLRIVLDAIEADGYKPAKQLTEYILSQDPTYITTLNDARGIMKNIDRELMLSVLIESFMKSC